MKLFLSQNRDPKSRKILLCNLQSWHVKLLERRALTGHGNAYTATWWDLHPEVLQATCEDSLLLVTMTTVTVKLPDHSLPWVPVLRNLSLVIMATCIVALTLTPWMSVLVHLCMLILQVYHFLSCPAIWLPVLLFMSIYAFKYNQGMKAFTF